MLGLTPEGYKQLVAKMAHEYLVAQFQAGQGPGVAVRALAVEVAVDLAKKVLSEANK